MDANPNPTDAVVDDAVEETVIDQPSEETEEEPSTEPKPEMLTKEQAEELANKRHSKLDTRIAELEKVTKISGKLVEAAEAKARAAEGALKEAQRMADEAEKASIGDNPDLLSIYEAKKQNREAAEQLRIEREALERERAEHADEIAEVKAIKTEKIALGIATENGVDASLLVTLTDGSREKMEALAKVLPKKEAGDNVPNLQKPPKPDSGKRSGAQGGPKTQEQLEKMSMSEYATYVAERDKNKYR